MSKLENRVIGIIFTICGLWVVAIKFNKEPAILTGFLLWIAAMVFGVLVICAAYAIKKRQIPLIEKVWISLLAMLTLVIAEGLIFTAIEYVDSRGDYLFRVLPAVAFIVWLKIDSYAGKKAVRSGGLNV
jgi:DMSO reductase anchor subunit